MADLVGKDIQADDLLVMLAVQGIGAENRTFLAAFFIADAPRGLGLAKGQRLGKQCGVQTIASWWLQFGQLPQL